MVHTVAKYLLVAFLASTYKTLPFAYVFRFYYRLIVNLALPRKRYLLNGKQNTFGITGKTNKLDLFEYTTMETYVSPLELDMYMHKSNSTYSIDLDIARTNVVTKVFQRFWYKYYDNENKEFKGMSLSNMPYVPVASIQCIFKKELRLYQRYNVKSQIFAWDEKWIFVLSKFVLPGSEKLCSIAITKYVFKKKQRITIKPEEIIKDCGLWNDEVVKVNKKNYEMVRYMASTEDLEKSCDQF